MKELFVAFNLLPTPHNLLLNLACQIIMKIRISFFVALASFLVLAGLGCKGLSKEQVAATKPISLEYWTVFDDVDALQAQINKFKADRPYLTVNLKQLRADELYPRLLEALAEDKGPDIISVRNRWMRFYQPKLAAMPSAVPDTTVRVEKTTLTKILSPMTTSLFTA